MENDIVKVENADIEVIEASQRAEIDMQIATAKKYPRSLKRVTDNCIAYVTMSEKIAESCKYTLPRGGKTLNGPTVHLARILIQQYGNVRASARVVRVTETQIISEAVCYDLETNYASKVEVIRSIIGRNGRFNDDMIVVAGNAANAISFRNAVYNVIPKGIVDAVYEAAIAKLTGDLSDVQKLTQARINSIKYFSETYGVTEEEILSIIGLRTINQLTPEKLAELRGIKQALIDGDATPDEVFPKKIVIPDPIPGQKQGQKPASELPFNDKK